MEIRGGRKPGIRVGRATGFFIVGCLARQREVSCSIIRFEKGILGITRFLASLRNDSGGGIMTFALPGTVRFLASLRNDSGGGIMAFALPGMTRFRPSCTVASTYPRCHLDRRERSHAALSASRKASSLGNTRFLASLEMAEVARLDKDENDRFGPVAADFSLHGGINFQGSLCCRIAHNGVWGCTFPGRKLQTSPSGAGVCHAIHTLSIYKT